MVRIPNQITEVITAHINRILQKNPNLKICLVLCPFWVAVKIDPEWLGRSRSRHTPVPPPLFHVEEPLSRRLSTWNLIVHHSASLWALKNVMAGFWCITVPDVQSKISEMSFIVNGIIPGVTRHPVQDINRRAAVEQMRNTAFTGPLFRNFSVSQSEFGLWVLH